MTSVDRARVPFGTGLLLATAVGLAAAPVLAQDESAAAGSAAPGAAGPGSAATVVPPGGEALGRTYVDWGADWWQWLMTVPPIEDPAVADCQAGQGGEVFFIPHVPPDFTVAVDCTVGADQWILASAGGTIWDNSDGSGNTPEDLVAMVEADVPIFSEPAVSIDGVDVADMASYWVVNPGFTIEYAEDNVYELPAGSWDAAMGGWFVMIPPLEPGAHTIVVRDMIDVPDDDQGPLLAELTTNLTVE
jgi:hypothetical protein